MENKDAPQSDASAAEDVATTEALDFELIVLLRHLTEIRRAVQADVGVTDRSAAAILMRIDQDGPRSIGQLRDALGLDDSTLNRQTAAAARAGLIERVPDPEGGIARKFALTDAGAQRLARERVAFAARVEPLVASWSAAQQRDLIEGVRRFNESFETTAGRAWRR